MPILETLLGANLGQVFKDVVSSFKVDPTVKAQIAAAIDANQAAVQQKQIELQEKAQDAITAEVQASAEVIKAEAQSQSWLPRNVRPLCLLMWGMTVTLNSLLPLINRFWNSGVQPIALDPWVYKLTAIGFTGYVTARTWEKVASNS